jgi:hypothetical protein
MAEALKLATSQGRRTTTHGGSSSLGFSLLDPWPLSLVLWVVEVMGMVGIWPWVLVVAVCLVIVGLWWCLG